MPCLSSCVCHPTDWQDDQASFSAIRHAWMAKAELEVWIRSPVKILVVYLRQPRWCSVRSAAAAAHMGQNVLVREHVSAIRSRIGLGAFLAGRRCPTGEDQRLSVTREAGRPLGQRVPGCMAHR